MKTGTLDVLGDLYFGGWQLVEDKYLSPPKTGKVVTSYGSFDIDSTYTKFGVGSGHFNNSNYDSYIKLLLHCDGVDGSTVITDATDKTVTAGGTAQIDTAQKKFGTGSLLLDGDSDYVYLSDRDDWYFGTGDFTIDLWVRLNAAVTGRMVLFGQMESGARYFKVAIEASGKMRMFFVYDGAGVGDVWTDDALAWTTGQWYHLAYVRNGSNAYLFRDGISIASTIATAFGDVGNVSAIAYIGANDGSGEYFNGWIDEFRISKGVARWTSNFTPPSLEYKAFSYLSIPDSEDFNFSTIDFTIDFWVRLNTLDTYNFIGAYDDATHYFNLYYNNSTNKLLSYWYNGATAATTYCNWAPSIHTWYHIAYVKRNLKASIYIDGVRQTMANDDFPNGAAYNFTTSVQIGRWNSDYYFNGWIEEMRVSRGIARWTKNFTPEASQYTTDKYTRLLLHFDSAETSGIPNPVTVEDVSESNFDSYCRLLLHGEGSEGSTTVLDASGTHKQITCNGNAQIDNPSWGAKFGTGCISFDGTGDYLSIPDHADWNFGTADFTIDFWVMFHSLSTCGFYMQYQDGTNSVRLFFQSNALKFTVRSTAEGEPIAMISSWSPSVHTWYHVALVRFENQTMMFINGTQIGTTDGTTYTVPNLSAAVHIGRMYSDPNEWFLNGWIDEYRVINGVAKWKNNFTPPTSAYSGDDPITSYTFSGLNGNADEEYMLIIRHTGGKATSNVYAQINNDTSTNYGYQHLQGEGGSKLAARNTASDRILLSINTADAGELNMSQTILSAKSGYVRTGIVKTVNKIAGTTVQDIDIQGVVWNNSVDNITSLKILSDQTAGIGTGSHIYLFKRMKLGDDFESGMTVGDLNIQGKLNAGIFQLVESYVVSGSAVTTKTFTGIDGNIDELYLIEIRQIAGAANSACWLRLNSDSSTYGRQNLTGTNATVDAARTTSDSAMIISNGQPDVADNDVLMASVLLYVKAGNGRTAINTVISEATGTTIEDIMIAGHVYDNTTDNITNLYFLSATDGFGVGTTINVYTLRRKPS